MPACTRSVRAPSSTLSSLFSRSVRTTTPRAQPPGADAQAEGLAGEGGTQPKLAVLWKILGGVGGWVGGWVRGDAGRCRAMQGDAGRCRAMQGDAGLPLLESLGV